jgi:hypothetical protein
MKRRDETKNVVACKIPNGDAFEYDDKLYIATNVFLPGDLRECVNLETGEMITFAAEVKVKCRLVELIVLNDVEE